MPIILSQVDYQDTYDGSFTDRRAVVYTLSFDAKTYLYVQHKLKKLLKKHNQICTQTVNTTPKAREERIIVIPNPESADADDDFGFTTTISNFADGKSYNIERDEDV